MSRGHLYKDVTCACRKQWLYMYTGTWSKINKNMSTVIRGNDDVNEVLRLLDEFSDNENDLLESEDDLDLDLEGDLESYNELPVRANQNEFVCQVTDGTVEQDPHHDVASAGTPPDPLRSSTEKPKHHKAQSKVCLIKYSMETEIDPDLYHVAGAWEDLGQEKGLLGQHYTMAVAPQDLDLTLVAHPPEQGQGVLQGVDLDHLVPVLTDLQVDLVVGLLVMVLLLLLFIVLRG